ncbi:MAG TPA: hypothetical protein VFL73_02385 [Solirubrobacteraceae bacterium]|nr:hypothetical protein [Solirubrobacteraceae bacterium]
MIRFLFRLSVLAGAGLLVKKALDARAAKALPATGAAPTPPAAAAPEPVRATAPADAPGPSVTPPGEGSETERAEAAERNVPEPPPDDDPLVAEEEAAAAAEAAAIGGPHLDDAHGDPAMEPVYEAGGGEAEGFEAAEEELIENASHGDGRGDPVRDAFTPEVEADEATAVDAEADEVIEADDREAGR